MFASFSAECRWLTECCCVHFQYGLRTGNHFGGPREGSLKAVTYSTFWGSVFPLSQSLGLPYLRTSISFSHKEEIEGWDPLCSPPPSPFFTQEYSNLPATNLLGLKNFTFVFTPYINQLAF